MGGASGPVGPKLETSALAPGPANGLETRAPARGEARVGPRVAGGAAGLANVIFCVGFAFLVLGAQS